MRKLCFDIPSDCPEAAKNLLIDAIKKCLPPTAELTIQEKELIISGSFNDEQLLGDLESIGGIRLTGLNQPSPQSDSPAKYYVDKVTIPKSSYRVLAFEDYLDDAINKVQCSIDKINRNVKLAQEIVQLAKAAMDRANDYAKEAIHNVHALWFSTHAIRQDKERANAVARKAKDLATQARAAYDEARQALDQAEHALYSTHVAYDFLTENRTSALEHLSTETEFTADTFADYEDRIKVELEQAARHYSRSSDCLDRAKTANARAQCIKNQTERQKDVTRQAMPKYTTKIHIDIDNIPHLQHRSFLAGLTKLAQNQNRNSPAVVGSRERFFSFIPTSTLENCPDLLSEEGQLDVTKFLQQLEAFGGIIVAPEQIEVTSEVGIQHVKIIGYTPVERHDEQTQAVM